MSAPEALQVRAGHRLVVGLAPGGKADAEQRAELIERLGVDVVIISGVSALATVAPAESGAIADDAIAVAVARERASERIAALSWPTAAARSAAELGYVLALDDVDGAHTAEVSAAAAAAEQRVEDLREELGRHIAALARHITGWEEQLRGAAADGPAADRADIERVIEHMARVRKGLDRG